MTSWASDMVRWLAHEEGEKRSHHSRRAGDLPGRIDLGNRGFWTWNSVVGAFGRGSNP